MMSFGCRVVVLVGIYSETFPDVPPDINLELPDSLLGGLEVKWLVRVHVLPGGRDKWLDVVRVVGAFHLDVVDP